MSRYNWVTHNGEKLFEVGIQSDGTLYNPRGYPEDDVRAAVLAADARCHERRSRAAKKAAETRRHRQEKKVYDIANRIVAGHSIGPPRRCAVCAKRLDDQQSIARGIGSECWQGVLRLITSARGAS
jgi:hypothetical protein